MNMERRWGLSVLLLVCFGCGDPAGPELGEVSGTISLDGEPLPNVNIQFTPSNGGPPSFGGTNAEGVYKLMFSHEASGAVLGTHDVSITARDVPTDENGNPVNSEKPPEIPARYQSPGALTADVKAGSNSVDLALDSK